MKVQRT